MSHVYSTCIIQRQVVAQDTLAFRVRRPRGFSFTAGQSVELTVINSADRDALGPSRSLSIASTPEADHLEFVVRLRDTAFKRNLTTIPIGSELFVAGPFDDLQFVPHENREFVFLAGGVGIAPFLSILRTAGSTGTAMPGTLFYSNRRPEDAPFLEELRQIEEKIKDLRVVPTMTRMAESSESWIGETTRIDLFFMQRHLQYFAGRKYYLVGAPQFVSQLRSILCGAGISDDDINLEMYSGY